MKRKHNKYFNTIIKIQIQFCFCGWSWSDDRSEKSLVKQMFSWAHVIVGKLLLCYLCFIVQVIV